MDGFAIDTTDVAKFATRYQSAAPIVRREMVTAMSRSVILIEGDGKRLAPVDRGHLRRSISHQVQQVSGGVEGKVGTNVPYAKPVEYGTGILSDAPDSSHNRYMPPPAALDGWAIRHGFTPYSASTSRKHAAAQPGTYGYAVAWIIYIRGGTKPKPYLRPALRNNLPRVDQEFTLVISRVMTAMTGYS